MECKHNNNKIVVIETGQAEPTSCCMPPHAAHMEEWIEPIKCLVCGRTGSRFYEFSDDERAAAAARYPDNPPEEYPWDDDHCTLVQWDDLKS
jgi:hypothetical protein